VTPEERLRQAHAGIGDAIETMRADADVIRAAYEAMPREWLKKILLVEYRCPNKRGCLLLRAWRSDDDRLLYYVCDYTLSPSRNAERTVESARKRNTLDGDRRWKPRAGDLSDLAEWGASIGLDLQCDHLDPVVVNGSDVLADAARATRGRPTRKVITARFA
jgi:hypothetical protein